MLFILLKNVIDGNWSFNKVLIFCQFIVRLKVYVFVSIMWGILGVDFENVIENL